MCDFIAQLVEHRTGIAEVTARQRENTMQYIHTIDGTNRNIQKVNNLLPGQYR